MLPLGYECIELIYHEGSNFLPLKGYICNIKGRLILLLMVVFSTIG